jgi:hypothetical protein
MVAWVLENKDAVILAVTSVISAAAAIAALTPSPKDDSLVAKVRKVIDFLALNWGNAKNAEPK